MKNKLNVFTKIGVLSFAVIIFWIVFFPKVSTEQDYYFFTTGVLLGVSGILFLIYKKLKKCGVVN